MPHNQSIHTREYRIMTPDHPQFDQSLKDYEYYFEQAEKHNKTPLCYSQWLIKQKYS